MFIRNIYYKLSPKYRFLVRKLYFAPIDVYENITGKRDLNMPKKGDIYTGSGDFKKSGEQHVELLKKFIQLKPTDNVLDIGSGLGRTAIPLTQFLDKDTKYEGFDVVEKGVDWCKKNISSKFSNFNFKFIALNNDLYNDFTETAETFVFPYEDETFDKAYLFSVFTHMRVEEIKNYIQEIERVLVNGGKCFATFFIYKENEDVSKFSSFKFPFKRNGYRLLNEKVEGANIALEYSFLQKMISDAGLELEQHIDGFWKDFNLDRKDRDFQDIIIIRKKIINN